MMAVNTPVAARVQPASPSAASSAYGLAVLILLSVVVGTAAQLISIVAADLSKSLALTDTELGIIQGVGILFIAALVSLPLCILADRVGRLPMAAVCILVCSIGAALTGLSQGLVSLLVGAIALGAMQMGIVPIMVGLVPQVVDERHRVFANAVYRAFELIGVSVGYIVTGLFIEALPTLQPSLPFGLAGLEPWRVVFLAMLLPGALILLMLWPVGRTVRPAGPDNDPLLDGDGLGALWRYVRRDGKLFFGFVVAVGLGNMGFVSMITWLPLVLSRQFGVETGAAATQIGMTTFVGSIVGAVVALWVSRRRPQGESGRDWPLRVIMAGTLTAAVSAGLMPVTGDATVALVLFGLMSAAVVPPYAMLPTCVQEMCPDSMLSRAGWLAGLMLALFSTVGTAVVGVWSDAAGGNTLFVASASVACAGLLAGTLLMLTIRPAYREMTRQRSAASA